MGKVIYKGSKVIYIDFRKNLDSPVDPCSECRDKPTCKDTCQKAIIYWENLANRLKGYDE